jgi:hypothetical protein
MNSNQKRVFLIGALLVVLMLLFPPWDYFDPDSSFRSRAGYHFFLAPPDPRNSEFLRQVRFPDLIRVEVDNVRLLIQLLITIPITLGVTLLFRSSRTSMTIVLSFLSLAVAAFVIAFIIWIDVSEWREYGKWNLLP